jgi:hypothetical protein
MRFSRMLAGAGALTALAALAFAAAAPASTWNPTGEWAPFGECPLSHLPFEYCVDLTVESGSLKLGNRTAHIVNPITLQGGEESATPEFIGTEFVETLNKVPEPVTGGLVGITAPGSWPAPVQTWWNNGIASGFTGVNATIELAAAPSSIELDLTNLLTESGTALGLPVKVHLENTLLGSNCYVGSNAQPIQLKLTTGTSGSLQGSTGTLSSNNGFTRLTFEGLKLVDNTFAAPAASGCGGIYSSLVDPLIDSIFGLPASSGENWLILEGDLRVGEAAEVFAFAMP